MGEGKGRRSKNLQHSEDVRTLLSALTTAEKRSALHELGGGRGATTRTEAELDEAIMTCGRSEGEVVETLRRTETSDPKKHCFFARVRGDTRRAVAKALAARGSTHEGVGITFTAQTDAMAWFTLERPVESYEWVSLPKQRGFAEVRGRKTTTHRHATIVRIDTATSQALLTYRGLTYKGAVVDYDYESVFSSTTAALAAVGLHLEPLPTGACITALITAKGRRVLPVRGDLITDRGEIKLRSLAGKATLEQLIARLIDSPEASENDLLAQITSGLAKATFNSIGLLWAEERVLTRVRFLPAGDEFLFVWGRTEPTYAFIDKMGALLYDLAAGMSSPDFNAIWSSISEMATDGILTAADFVSKVARPRSETEAVILEAVKAGLLEPVYTLKAEGDVLDELGLTDWTTNLASLRQVFTTQDGVTFDGADPRSIRVAFRRVRVGGKRALP